MYMHTCKDLKDEKLGDLMKCRDERGDGVQWGSLMKICRRAGSKKDVVEKPGEVPCTSFIL